MKVIALKGRRNTGKTTTIKLLSDILISNGYTQVQGMYQNNRRGDFLDIYNNGTKKVGLSSAGDTDLVINKNLNDLQINSCDIAVCACRTRGGTITAIKSFDPNPTIINKTISSSSINWSTDNSNDAQIIFSKI